MLKKPRMANRGGPASILTLLIILISVAPLWAFADSQTTIVVAADEWCPYNCSPNSDSPGLIIEVLKEVYSEHNVNVEYRILPWKRAIKETETGIIDAAVGAVQGNHGRNIINEENFGKDETVFVTRKQNSFNYNSSSSLDGMTIGVIANYTYDNHGEIDTYIQTRKSDNNNIYVVHQERPLESLFKMLLNGRIDTFPENKYVSSYMAKKMGVDSNIKFVTTGLGDNVYVAFSPNDSGRENAIKLDEGLRKLRQNGTFEQLLKKYGIN